MLDRRQALIAGCATLAAVLAPTASAMPLPPEVAAELPGARLLGSGRLRWFGLHVYDARLWAGADAPAGAARAEFTRFPLALELEYARALPGARIAERSLEEMRRGGQLAAAQEQAWLAFMRQHFPDVEAGDRITGVQRPSELSRFHVNGNFVAERRDADFMRLFFGIWLGPQSSQPRLRNELLGLGS
jgi:Chalcone isomerase-like